MGRRNLRVIASNAAMAPGRCSRCGIRDGAICGALSNEELADLSPSSRMRRIGAGETIMSESERADFYANIVSGTVKVIKLLPDGRQQIVGLKFAPDFLGRIYGPRYPYFAVAASDVELCCFPRAEFQRMLEDCPHLERRLFENTLADLDAARDWMVVLGRKSAREKVASFLEMVAKRTLDAGGAKQRPAGGVEFSSPLSRADIADYLGLTIETVSRQFAWLRAKGVIVASPHSRDVVIRDMDALSEISGQYS